MLHAGGIGVDLVGEAIPSWIMAATGVATLLAAIAAALFARKAASHAGEQVKEAAAQTAEAHRQVELSVRQEAIAQRTLKAQIDESRRQHDAAIRVERRALEARLDERMPFIIARARLPFRNLQQRPYGNDGWLPVDEQLRVGSRNAPAFQQEVSVRLENVSVMPARIDIVDAAGGEFQGQPSGQPLVVGPGETADLRWQRQFSGTALASGDLRDQPDPQLFSVRFWVRDLAMLVRDEYVFSASLPHFKKDGSQLVIAPIPREFWPSGQSIAELLPERLYERLKPVSQDE